MTIRLSFALVSLAAISTAVGFQHQSPALRTRPCQLAKPRSRCPASMALSLPVADVKELATKVYTHPVSIESVVSTAASSSRKLVKVLAKFSNVVLATAVQLLAQLQMVAAQAAGFIAAASGDALTVRRVTVAYGLHVV